MKFKHLFQILVLLAILVSVFGTGQSAQASPQQVVQIVMRDLTYWDGIYTGNVDANRYEKWPLNFAETHSFVVTATPLTTGGLVPLLLLLDSNGNEISHSTGSLTSTQPLGSYYIQVQPESGGGLYTLTIRQVPPAANSSVSTVVNPATIDVGQSSVATVSLNNVPATGYTSAEFTCTYNPTLVKVSDIAEVVPGLFGSDAATAINDPQNGSFIFAIAGSNGKKATTSGAVFKFNLKGLAAGVAAIECKARVSTGGNTLIDLSFTAATLTVVIPNGTLTGKVIASKPVTVHLYKADNSIAASVTANADGTFSLTAPAGTYTVDATAVGFLSAKTRDPAPATITITSGATTTMSTISLLAGDIDNDGVIGQLDAMTIGMNYNKATPAAADLNNDGTINVLDLELLARNYRLVGPTDWQ